MTDLLTGPQLDGHAEPPEPPSGPGAWRGRAAHLAATTRAAAVKWGLAAARWRWTPALPGLAGAGLVSAALAVRFGVWAGLLAAGLFCLRADARL